MVWIEPLDLETILLNIFAGSPNIFVGLSIIIISAMAGFFRMNGISMFFMIGLFLLMFSGYVPTTLVVFITIIASLLVGYWIARLIK
jgi:ABC-type multidrug transport system permease subunit